MKLTVGLPSLSFVLTMPGWGSGSTTSKAQSLSLAL